MVGGGLHQTRGEGRPLGAETIMKGERGAQASLGITIAGSRHRRCTNRLEAMKLVQSLKKVNTTKTTEVMVMVTGNWNKVVSRSQILQDLKSPG